MKSESSEEKMLQSISKELGIPNLLDTLSETTMSRLVPILLSAWKERCKKIKPSQVLNVYEVMFPFFAPSPVNQRDLLKLACECYGVLEGKYTDVQLSPIVPLGTNGSVTSISQSNVMSTIRNAEIVSDVTTQLALECAQLRKKAKGKDDTFRLCSFQRVLRMQPFDASRGYMQHFSLFDLCTGGPAKSAGRFGMGWIREHISANLDMLLALTKMGYNFREVTVCVSDMRFLEAIIRHFELFRGEILWNTLNDDFDLFKECNIHLIPEVKNLEEIECFSSIEQMGLVRYERFLAHAFNEIINPLREQYPGIEFRWDFARKAGIGYYKPLCFHIFGERQSGERVVLSDGGAVSWLNQLTGSSREAMVISGIGAELIVRLFGPK